MIARPPGPAFPAGHRLARAWGIAAYGAAFAVVLPLLIALWMERLDRFVRLPAFGDALGGAAVIGVGLAVMGAAMRTLWRDGGGLPMSPFPPRRLVSSGLYALIPHPIYVGAVTTCLGYALFTSSPGGLWVVTPLLALAAASFVLGYEREATRTWFGALAQPRLRLPPDEDARAGAWDRVSVYALVMIPWAVAYEALNRVGMAPDAHSSYLGWETSVPVVPWTEAISVLTYPYVALAPLLASRRCDLRRFGIRGLWAAAAIGLFYLVVPFTASPKPVSDDSVWAPLLAFERAWDEHTSLPSFLVVWACLTSALLASRWPRLKWWLAAWTVAIAASCVTTGMHAVIDVVAGFVAAALVMRGGVLWAAQCRFVGAVANSWREWRAGPLRVLSHGVFAALGGALGAAVAVWAAGEDQLWWVVGLTFGAQIGAGLWAQLIEGSPQLLRPYGYFGAVAAVVLLSAGAAASGRDPWLPLAAMAVGACFTQVFGRLRCLVQGCCHGRPVDAPWGIRYTHPRSRVTRLSGWGGVPLHPTPLYSMLWMLMTGAILLRLWVLGAPLPVVAGGYLVLVGLGRFVEEHYRGEPQTATVAGLRLYQWLAIAFVCGGSVLMAVGGTPAPRPQALEPRTWGVLVLVFLVTYVLFGVDVPGSNRRFSRLV
jgi:protein-S-isoprenylcysteine O-methyltransferase Ste14